MHQLCPPFLVRFLLGTPLCAAPIPRQTWASCSSSVLVQNVLSQVHSFRTSVRFPTRPFVGLLVSAACSLLSHSTDCQHHRSKNCKSQALSPSRRLTQLVLHLLASTGEIHRCGQACRQKLLNLAHPQNGFAPSTLLQMAQLLQCSPCPG